MDIPTIAHKIRELLYENETRVPYLFATVAALVLYGLYTSLWYYPIVYKKNPNFGQKRSLCVTIAHRGSRGEGLPENTIAAFRDAVAAGADVVELDVWLTTDQKVVVHHDVTLSRMTRGASHQRIADVKYSDIPPITVTKAQARRMEGFSKRECLTIPLFEDVLAAIPHPTLLNIEFKQNSDVLIAEVKRILYENDRTRDVFWFSLNEKINKKLRAADPTIPTITSISGVLKYLALYYVGLLPFFPIHDSVLGITVEEVTMEKVQHEKATARLPHFLQRFLCYLFSGKPPYFMVAPGMFAHLRRRGVQVWFVGVNTERELLHAVENGATGVLTDRIHWLKKTIREKNIVFKHIE